MKTKYPFQILVVDPNKSDVGDGLIVKSKGKNDKKLKTLNIKIRKEKFTSGGEIIIKFSDDCLPELIN